MRPDEIQVRRVAAQHATKIAALDWLDAQFASNQHGTACASMDPTGHAAPCNCGASSMIRIETFIRKAIVDCPIHT